MKSAPSRPRHRCQARPRAAVGHALISCGILAAFGSSSAAAQSTTDNATTDSDDAFGRQIGTERTGLYSSSYVRGFDPVEAGNARLEDLYFDKIDRLPGRVVDGTTMRVSYASQRFPFPAPTGLVDQALRKPDDEAIATLNLEYGPRFRGLIQVEFELPLMASELGLSGGFSQRWRYDTQGTISTSTTYGLLARYAPAARVEFIGFGGITQERGEVAGPILFPAEGADLPPRLERGQELGQPWAKKKIDRPSGGVVAKFPIGSARLETGLFLNERTRIDNFSDINSGVTPDGQVASRTIVADAGTLDRALSGEIRLVRDWSAGTASHRLILSARGRNRDRRFGGAQRIELGPSTLLERDYREQPAFTVGPKNTDEVRQRLFGAAYSLLFGDRFGFDLGLTWSDYQKRVGFADASRPAISSSDGRVLWNVAASYDLWRNVTVFGGITRGLEDAPIAPDRAANRAEAPPAIRTRQEEAGLRITLNDSLTLLGGVFRITKPYYNLDPALNYRELGSLNTPGFEFSLTGSLAPGLTIVAGSVFLKPQIEGEAVDAGLIGERPVGQETRRSTLNVDWRSGKGDGPISLDLAVVSKSSVFADATNSLSVPSQLSFDIGARYRLDLADIPVVVRPRIQNLFNEYSWNVSSSGGLTYSDPRSISLQLLADL